MDRQLRSDLANTLNGIEAYMVHPYQRVVDKPEIIWQSGGSSLLDYGSDRSVSGRPVIFVPSLVNRAYILDLMADNSLLRWLSAQGLHPYLLDWGIPGQAEAGFGLAGYIKRLNTVIDIVKNLKTAPVGLTGYCMGGLLTLAAAMGKQDDISGVALLATPWDFHSPTERTAKLYASYIRAIEPVLKEQGQLSVDILQSLFIGLDPMLMVNKFSKFACLDVASPQANQFVALEDWLNDGVPLEAEVARNCFVDWYRDNLPAKGEWIIDGQTINPQYFQKPSLTITPTGDRIVPFESAAPLSHQLPKNKDLRPAFGHIGMIVGRGSRTAVWQPLSAFFNSL